jgi:CIC family chloride channel protein
MGALGAAVAVGLTRGFAPEASGSGIPHVKAVLHGLRDLRWLRVICVKFVGGVSGIGGGLALGREGPTIQMGAAVGKMVSAWFSSTPRERRTLIAAGSGAGLAAAFNAPISGLVFVLEEMERHFSQGVFAITLIASAVADVTTRLLLGQLPVFHVEVPSIPSLTALPVALVLGAIAGILGIAFNRGLVWSLSIFDRLQHLPPAVIGALVGSVIGFVALVAPGSVGGGNRLIERILAGDVPLFPLFGFFALRFVLTMASYGCGAPGGIFAPLLVLGSAIGLAVGDVSAHLFPQAVEHPESFAVVGMAAYFSAIVRAPLTGIVLIVEMTGNYSLVLSLLVACLASYGVADFLGDRPVYEALLERDLLREEPTSEAASGTMLLDLTIAPGASFAGKRVRELGLPTGCILILLRHGLHEHVPTAESMLNEGDHVTALISGESTKAIVMLRKGAGIDSAIS